MPVDLAASVVLDPWLLFLRMKNRQDCDVNSEIRRQKYTRYGASHYIALLQCLPSRLAKWCLQVDTLLLANSKNHHLHYDVGGVLQYLPRRIEKHANEHCYALELQIL